MSNKLLLLLLFFPLLVGAQDVTQTDSCVDCHADKGWRVTHKQLFDYYQRWNGSSHESEGVTCTDCHGGDAGKPGKEAAHGRGMGPESEQNAVNFRQVPETCGTCHHSFYSAYQQSKHFKNLEDSKVQGPNCITCHGSMNTNRPDVNTVREICLQCHDVGKTPDIPAAAETLLNNLNAIRRYESYIRKRGTPEEVATIFKQLDPLLDKVNESWHHFDLDLIQKHTAILLDLARQKRDQVRDRRISSAKKSKE